MILNVYDSNYTPIGKMQRYDQLQWLRCWSGCGEFQLKLTGTSELLRRGNVLRSDGDIGIIEQVTIAETESGEETIVRGRPLLSLLSRRVVAADFVCTGQIEEILNQLITANLRGLSFALDLVSGAAGVQMEYSVEAGKNLLECVEAIAEAGGIGVFVDVIDGVPTMSLKHAALRQGYFASENGTLRSKEYDESDYDMRNVCYVSCKDLLVVVGDAEGDDRHEHFVTMTNTRDADGNELTQDTLRALMYDKGVETLAGLQLVQALSCEVNPHGQLEYGVDYELGDFVTIKAMSWGVFMVAQILRIKENYDSSGYMLEVTFGNQYLNGIQRIKKGVA